MPFDCPVNILTLFKPAPACDDNPPAVCFSTDF